jgi:hypothetical protein
MLKQTGRGVFKVIHENVDAMGKLPGAYVDLAKSKFQSKVQLDRGARQLTKKIDSPTILGEKSYNKSFKTLRGLLEKADVKGIKSYISDQRKKVAKQKEEEK